MITLISQKTSLIAVLLIFLLITISAGSLNSSVIIVSNGTISYTVTSVASQSSEIRGALVKYIFNYNHDDNVICQTLSSYGFNAVYLEVNPFSWTGYMLKDFDSMITACKQYGLSFHVLVLLDAGFDTSYSDASESSYPRYGLTGYNPDWRMVLDDGTPVDFPSFARSSTQARVKQVIQTMLTVYPYISDLNLDYVRYPSSELSSITNINYRVSYDDQSEAQFQAWLTANNKSFTGSWSDYYYGGSRYKDFATWRCVPINNMVKNIREWAHEINQSVAISADVWTPYSGWTPDTYPYTLGQDPAFWISQRYIDYINPMNYVGTVSEMNSRLSLEQQYWLGDTKGAVPLVPFITQGGSGADVGSPMSISTWIQVIDTIRQKGCNGFIIWRYNGPGFSESPAWTNLVPYLAAIRDNSTKGAFPVFQQTLPAVQGSTIKWQTSLATNGKVEYSTSPMFVATPKNGTLLPYVDIDYVNGTILPELTPAQNHSITIPVASPFYYRIRDADSYIELISATYQVTG